MLYKPSNLSPNLSAEILNYTNGQWELKNDEIIFRFVTNTNGSQVRSYKIELINYLDLEDDDDSNILYTQYGDFPIPLNDKTEGSISITKDRLNDLIYSDEQDLRWRIRLYEDQIYATEQSRQSLQGVTHIGNGYTVGSTRNVIWTRHYNPNLVVDSYVELYFESNDVATDFAPFGLEWDSSTGTLNKKEGEVPDVAPYVSGECRLPIYDKNSPNMILNTYKSKMVDGHMYIQARIDGGSYKDDWSDVRLIQSLENDAKGITYAVWDDNQGSLPLLSYKYYRLIYQERRQIVSVDQSIGYHNLTKIVLDEPMNYSKVASGLPPHTSYPKLSTGLQSDDFASNRVYIKPIPEFDENNNGVGYINITTTKHESLFKYYDGSLSSTQFNEVPSHKQWYPYLYWVQDTGGYRPIGAKPLDWDQNVRTKEYYENLYYAHSYQSNVYLSGVTEPQSSYAQGNFLIFHFNQSEINLTQVENLLSTGEDIAFKKSDTSEVYFGTIKDIYIPPDPPDNDKYISVKIELKQDISAGTYFIQIEQKYSLQPATSEQGDISWELSLRQQCLLTDFNGAKVTDGSGHLESNSSKYCKAIINYVATTGECALFSKLAFEPNIQYQYELFLIDKSKDVTLDNPLYKCIQPVQYYLGGAEKFLSRTLDTEMMTNNILSSNPDDFAMVNELQLFIQPNIGIKEDVYKPCKLTLYNKYRMYGVPEVSGYITNAFADIGSYNKFLSIDKLDDTQWLVTFKKTDYTGTLDLSRALFYLYPQTPYEIYTNFVDSIPEGYFYLRSNKIGNFKFNTPFFDIEQDIQISGHFEENGNNFQTVEPFSYRDLLITAEVSDMDKGILSEGNQVWNLTYPQNQVPIQSYYYEIFSIDQNNNQTLIYHQDNQYNDTLQCVYYGLKNNRRYLIVLNIQDELNTVFVGQCVINVQYTENIAIDGIDAQYDCKILANHLGFTPLQNLTGGQVDLNGNIGGAIVSQPNGILYQQTSATKEISIPENWTGGVKVGITPQMVEKQNIYTMFEIQDDSGKTIKLQFDTRVVILDEETKTYKLNSNYMFFIWTNEEVIKYYTLQQILTNIKIPATLRYFLDTIKKEDSDETFIGLFAEEEDVVAWNMQCVNDNQVNLVFNNQSSFNQNWYIGSTQSIMQMIWEENTDKVTRTGTYHIYTGGTNYEVDSFVLSNCIDSRKANNLILNNTSYEIGDVNRDCLIDNLDVEKLTLYLAKSPEAEDIDKAAADINQDGKINAKDLSELQNLIKE